MSVSSRLSNSLKGSSSRRLLIVGGAVAVAGVAYFVFSQPSPQVTPSAIRTPPTQETVQGRNPVTPQMENELATADQSRLNEALETNTSTMPTIRITKYQDLNLTEPAPEEELPVVERPPAPVIQRPTVTATPLPPAPAPVQPAQVQAQTQTINLSETMSAMALPTYPAANVNYYWDGVLPEDEPVAQAPAASAAAVNPAGAGSDEINLPLPGTILYAQLISEANSDSPGPVLAEIVQGELAGARLIGQFTTQRDALVISFTSLTMGTDRNGNEINQSVPISAYAVDPTNIGTGMATSVDYHLLQNLGITFAAAFVQGFGEALSQSGREVIRDGDTTTVINPTLTTEQQLLVASGTAAGAAGQTLQSLFGNRPATIKVKSGTGLGVLFLSGS